MRGNTNEAQAKNTKQAFGRSDKKMVGNKQYNTQQHIAVARSNERIHDNVVVTSYSYIHRLSLIHLKAFLFLFVQKKQPNTNTLRL